MSSTETSEEYDQSLITGVAYAGQGTNTSVVTPPATNTTSTSDVTLLQQLLVLLSGIYGAGGSTLTIEYHTGGTTPFVIYTTQKPVKFGFIQNLSSTDTLTIGANTKNPGVPIVGLTTGGGLVLNSAPLSGAAGTGFPTGNIDLSTLTLVFETNASQAYSVAYLT